MKTGTAVIARRTITENDVNGLVTHARRGDLGKVVHVDGLGVATVLFERSGTATIVADDEVQPLALA